MLPHAALLYTLVLLAGDAPPPRPFEPVPASDVRVADAFFSPRIETNRTRTLPHCLDTCEKTGRLANFRRAAGREEGPFQGIYFNDSDVYKAIEGASYALAAHPDPALDARLDAIIDDIAAAQREDGYLNTYYTLAEPGKRWTNLPQMHELYCAGHLIEAAVAHFQATGKRTLLDVALRLAAHVDATFGPGEGKRRGVPGHEEIELALVRLHRATGEARWLRLAKHFVDERGAPGRELYGEYCQDHLPVREQSEIVGHAVRAMYLYSAATDVAALTGDKALVAAMDRLWNDVVGTKMYVTGGIGSSASNEGFTTAYDLPNDAAYAETCAAIGLAFWNHRLLLLHGDGKYGDVLERVLYNGFLSGVSRDGDRFFYVNPLASRGRHHRQPWFDCACCPVNVVRFLPSLGGLVYGKRRGGAGVEEAISVNLFVEGSATIALDAATVRVAQETRYPWDGRVTVRIDPAAPARFELRVRLPAFAAGARAAVNGSPVDVAAATDRAFLSIEREWKPGDALVLDLPLEPRRVEAHPAVAADRGRVALARGPLVYCLEAADHAAPVRSLFLPRDARIEAVPAPDFLGGAAVALRANAFSAPPAAAGDVLYRDAPKPESNILTAVPYFAWDHRSPGDMIVWIPESAGLAETRSPPSLAVRATPSASHCFERDTVVALNDGVEPGRSSDHSIPRFTWWDKSGTVEWAELAFPEKVAVSRVDVYWFDDAGGCRLPESWRLLWRDGGEWKTVPGTSKLGAVADRYQTVRFPEVVTDALRVEATLRSGASAGLLEWRVEPAGQAGNGGE